MIEDIYNAQWKMLWLGMVHINPKMDMGVPAPQTLINGWFYSLCQK